MSNTLDIDANQNSTNETSRKKKNRTLQFYKFLFYSIKVEIKAHEFVEMVRFANIGEICLWVISLIFYCCTSEFPNTDEKGKKVDLNKNGFIWVQIIHVVRAITGLIIYYSFPKTFLPVETVKQTDENKLETVFFNDLVRDTVNETVIKPIQSKKVALFLYVGLTFFDILVDAISFLAFIANLHKAVPSIKVVIMAYVYIDVIYLVLDFRYVLWLRTLKYVFPPKYTGPIADAFYGAASRLKYRFKIGKPKTDINKELPKVEDIITGNPNHLSEKVGNSFGNSNPDDVRIDI